MTAADFRIGDRAITTASVRLERFAGKTGTVVNLNLRDEEVGLWLGNYGSDGHRAVTWFRLCEVEAAADTATVAFQAPVLSSSALRSTDLAELVL